MQALEAFFSKDDDSLSACLYAVAPAVDATISSPAPPPPQQDNGTSRLTAHQLDCSGVLVTAEMLMSVFDTELDQWGLLFRGKLTPRTGFGSSGSKVSSAAR